MLKLTQLSLNVCLSTLLSWTSIAQITPTENIQTIQVRALSESPYSRVQDMGTVYSIAFDDLNADQAAYFYKIEHKNPDWSDSNLNSSEYLKGFQEFEIFNFENAINTLQNYTHYHFSIPNQNTQITLSGNYLVTVTNEYGDPIFSRKLIWSEQLVGIGAQVKRPINLNLMNQKQSVVFDVYYDKIKTANPRDEFYVEIIQNNDFNLSKKNLIPDFYEANKLRYQLEKNTVFWGGNEFLQFDIKNLINTDVYTLRSEQIDNQNHVTLFSQIDRSQQAYTFLPDINGQFIVRNVFRENAAVEADYAWVYFSLSAPADIQGKIYVYGAFNNFKLKGENELIYNKTTQNWECPIYLKQGYYNYTFARKKQNENIDLQRLNGSFFDTENNYTILVYHQLTGERHPKLIGAKTLQINQITPN